MKIKIDENLPPALAVCLEGLAHDVDTVADEGLSGVNDDAVWRAAQAEERFFITQDKDFADARKYPAGIHFGILILRFGHLKMTGIVDRVKAIFETEPVETWARCCIAANEWRVRVNRPAV